MMLVVLTQNVTPPPIYSVYNIVRPRKTVNSYNSCTSKRLQLSDYQNIYADSVAAHLLSRCSSRHVDTPVTNTS